MEPNLTNFWLAAAFGVGAIWVNAWGQFDRSTYGQSFEFKRLLARLQPSEIQASRIYLQAFALYSTVLTILYGIVCLYIVMVQPLLERSGITFPGMDFLDGIAGAAKLPKPGAPPIAGVAFDEAGGLLGAVGPAGPSPSIPLAVSVAVVGLAPNVPVLSNIEEYIRATAHRLCGIPSQIVDSAMLLHRSLDIPVRPPEQSNGDADALLLTGDDWKQIQSLGDAAARAGRIGELSAFRRETARLLALRRWILKRRIFLSGGAAFSAYSAIEAEVSLRVDKLLVDLDAAAADPVPASQRPIQVSRPVDWPTSMLETEQAVADLCLLVALFSYKVDFRRAVAQQAKNVKSSDEERQRHEAARLLSKALEEASLTTDRGSVWMLVFFRSAWIILVIAALAGFLWGDDRVIDGRNVFNSVGTSVAYSINAILTYIVPLFVALNYQNMRKDSDNWENVFSKKARQSEIIMQLVGILLGTSLLALVGRAAFNIGNTAWSQGIVAVQERLGLVVQNATWGELIDALNAGFFAVMLSLIVDLALIVDAEGREKFDRYKWKLVWLSALAIGVIAGLARWRASLIAGQEFAFGLVAKAAATPLLVSLLCGVMVVLTLQDEITGREGKG